MATPEDQAREHIDQALEKAGWRVQDYKDTNLQAGRGVAIRNFPLASGHGFADYLIYMGKLLGLLKPRKKDSRWLGLKCRR